MQVAAFKKKYPSVSITPARFLSVAEHRKKLHISGNDVVHALHNIRSIFESLPEYQRILLNQAEVKIALHNMHGSQHDLKASRIRLDVRHLSRFQYNPKPPVINDWQRCVESIINEEATHTVCKKFHNTDEWINKTISDRAEANWIRHTLLVAHRAYNSFLNDKGEEQCKAPLEDYGFSDVVAAEIPAEIVHIRNFLLAAKKYGRKSLVSERPQFRDRPQYFLDDWRSKLDHVPAAEMGAKIDQILTKAFPQSYPAFQSHEREFIREAEAIKAQGKRPLSPDKFKSPRPDRLR